MWGMPRDSQAADAGDAVAGGTTWGICLCQWCSSAGLWRGAMWWTARSKFWLSLPGGHGGVLATRCWPWLAVAPLAGLAVGHAAGFPSWCCWWAYQKVSWGALGDNGLEPGAGRAATAVAAGRPLGMLLTLVWMAPLVLGADGGVRLAQAHRGAAGLGWRRRGDADHEQGLWHRVAVRADGGLDGTAEQVDGDRPMACQARWAATPARGSGQGRMHWQACPAWSRCRRWAGRRLPAWPSGCWCSSAAASPKGRSGARWSGVGSPAAHFARDLDKARQHRTPAGRPGETSARLLPRPRPRQPPAARVCNRLRPSCTARLASTALKLRATTSARCAATVADLLGQGLRTERKGRCSPPGRKGFGHQEAQHMALAGWGGQQHTGPGLGGRCGQRLQGLGSTSFWGLAVAPQTPAARRVSGVTTATVSGAKSWVTPAQATAKQRLGQGPGAGRPHRGA